MGRKSAASVAKSKERRLQRKEEQTRVSQAMGAVAAANALRDPMEPFPVFKEYRKEGLDVELSVSRCSTADEEVKRWAFELTKRNMLPKYEQSSWGWNDKKKWEELTDDSAWYLIAKAKTGEFLGFSHFRFDLDEGIEVLYCYELQLEPGVQRKGLGKFMMQILELIAFRNNMRKVVLTVLKNNHYSKFFKSINYVLDESSPIDGEDGTFSYEILSKVNRRLEPNPGAAKTGKNSNGGHCCSGHNHCHYVPFEKSNE